MNIVGLGGLLNDAACAVVKDGELAAAVEQKKAARRFAPGQIPVDALSACLKISGIGAGDVDVAAIVRPFTWGSEAAFHLILRETLISLP